VLEGSRASVVVYGSACSGKTHTLIGTDADPGILPRAVSSLFEAADIFLAGRPSTAEGPSVTIEMSYLEIHDDGLLDLCAPYDDLVLHPFSPQCPRIGRADRPPTARRGAEGAAPTAPPDPPQRIPLESADHFSRCFRRARLAHTASAPRAGAAAAAARPTALALYIHSTDGRAAAYR
jgi:hypothetical protein